VYVLEISFYETNNETKGDPPSPKGERKRTENKRKGKRKEKLSSKVYKKKLEVTLYMFLESREKTIKREKHSCGQKSL
jgi:hypothetical protein